MNQEDGFSSEQQEYLKGFFQGVSQRMNVIPLGPGRQGQTGEVGAEVYGTPIDELNKEEKIKYDQNGLDVWDTILKNSRLGKFPEAADGFRYKFFGLFHVAPTQNSLMLRCRIPGGRLTDHQLNGLADIAERQGGGYLDITTRANIQIREIAPKNAIQTLLSLEELGLTSKGSGADNIRNITASPTTGFDPQELLDVMPHARAMHSAILHNRDLYGLPRKFNISYDAGGKVSACTATNDIGFYAVRVSDAENLSPGVYFRVQLCGITGHKQFANDCGLLIRPEEHVEVASAMIRVFIENGDRTNRNRARLKYLVDKWGVEKFLEETQKKLDFPLNRHPLDKCNPRPPTIQDGHIGIYPQLQRDRHYVGLAVPVGRLLPDQARNLARISRIYGQGEVRLTVWQNVLVPHVPTRDIDNFKDEVRETGLDWETHSFRSGLVACTGNTGCRYAAANTKSHAIDLADKLAKKFQLDHPINIHLTGCPHSCAQHYIGDIGLIASPSRQGDKTVEGYSIVFGGGVEEREGIGREVFKAIPYPSIPRLLESCLNRYLQNRTNGESFNVFIRRHSEEELKKIFTQNVITST